MTTPSHRPLRVLFLCTRNSARSQIAEAVMTRKVERLAPGRFVVGSAGSEPGEAVHPLALEVLREHEIDWSGRPKSIESVRSVEPWDLIIAVCDRAREACPVFPGQPVYADWGMNDPAEVGGGEQERRRAFQETLRYLSRRIDLLLSLPFEKLERRAIELRVQQIARGTFRCCI